MFQSALACPFREDDKARGDHVCIVLHCLFLHLHVCLSFVTHWVETKDFFSVSINLSDIRHAHLICDFCLSGLDY